MEDKSGLERSVLTYVDISLQRPGRYYLIIDESYGKALFAVDQIEVTPESVKAYRDNPTIELVVQFSPQLPWRIVNTKDVYLQSTKEVMEREGQETKELREFRAELLKQLGMDNRGEPLAGLPEGVVVSGTGQYL